MKNIFKVNMIGFIAPLALTLAACTSFGLNDKHPQLSLPSKYIESNSALEKKLDSKISSTWWTAYQDQQLNDLLSQALKNNTDIKRATARIEESGAFAREVGAATFPQVDLNAGASRTHAASFAENSLISNPSNHYKVALGASFEVDFWGKLRSAQESARAQMLSSQYAQDTLALSLSGLVTSHYFILRSLDSQIAITNENIKSRAASLSLTQRRLEGGVASALDVYQAEVASANLVAQSAELKRLRALTLHQLAVLTGDLSLNIASTKLSTLIVPPTPPEGLPSSLMEARPDIAQAEQQMLAANANISVAKAALYPSISLTAGFGGESLALTDILKSASRIWTGGVALYLPVFNAGKLNARIDRASAQQKEALANYEGVVQNAFREVNDALVNLRQNTEREEALNKSKIAAKKALDVAENRYQSGYSAYLDVLDAQRVYHDASLVYVQSHEAKLLAGVALFKVLGGGWQKAN